MVAEQFISGYTFMFIGAVAFLCARAASPFLSSRKRLTIESIIDANAIATIPKDRDGTSATLKNAFASTNKTRMIKGLPIEMNALEKHRTLKSDMLFGMPEEKYSIHSLSTRMTNGHVFPKSSASRRTLLTALKLYEAAVLYGPSPTAATPSQILEANNVINRGPGISGMHTVPVPTGILVHTNAGEFSLQKSIQHLPYNGNFMLLYLDSCGLVAYNDI